MIPEDFHTPSILDDFPSANVPKETIPFTKEAVKKYLDDCIILSRKERDSGEEKARMYGYYVDAYQSVRTSLFGEILPVIEIE